MFKMGKAARMKFGKKISPTMNKAVIPQSHFQIRVLKKVITLATKLTVMSPHLWWWMKQPKQ